MRLCGHRRTNQIEDCLLFDSSVAETQPGETVPLLTHLSRQNFEMAPVHMTNHQVSSSGTSRANPGVNQSVEMNSESSLFQTYNRGRLLLHCHCILHGLALFLYIISSQEMTGVYSRV